jgi:DNA-binding NarL/FixJ family response regulator
VSTERSLRIVVADDSALLRKGIVSLLEDVGHEVIGRSASADDLLVKVRSLGPDIAIVDVRMPPGNADDGLVAAVEIRSSHPDVAVLVLSQHLEPA